MRLHFICDRCGGKRFVVGSPTDFPDRCSLCRAKGKLTIGRMAVLLGVKRRDIESVLRPEISTRVSTAQRVFRKAIDLLGSERQQRMFS